MKALTKIGTEILLRLKQVHVDTKRNISNINNRTLQSISKHTNILIERGLVEESHDFLCPHCKKSVLIEFEEGVLRLTELSEKVANKLNEINELLEEKV